MKSFKKFLVENMNTQEVANLIKDKCQPFLREIGKNVIEYPMYRGMQGDTARITQVRKDRIPKDTDPKLHKMIDDWLADRFGIKFRSQAMFCTGSPSQAEFYGRVHLVFPVGKFDFAYSRETDDLWRFFTNYKMHVAAKPGTSLSKDEVEKLMVDLNFTNTHLSKGISSRKELMIACDEYVAIPVYSNHGSRFLNYLNSVI